MNQNHHPREEPSSCYMTPHPLHGLYQRRSRQRTPQPDADRRATFRKNWKSKTTL